MEAIIPTKLEQMVKKFKAHECTLDFDHRFCKAIYKEDLPGDKYLCFNINILLLFIIIVANCICCQIDI